MAIKSLILLTQITLFIPFVVLIIILHKINPIFSLYIGKLLNLGGQKMPTVYICKKCQSTISCIEVIKREPYNLCDECEKECHVRKKPQSYSHVYEILEGGLCNTCYSLEVKNEL